MNATSSGRGRRRRPKPVTVFFDRNLGKSLPRALDILPQLKVKHMRDVYPNDGQEIEDTEWLARAGKHAEAIDAWRVSGARPQPSGSHCVPSSTR